MNSQAYKAKIQQLFHARWLPDLLALAGGIVYLFQALQNAVSRTSFLDEGLYLFKGWLFASGRYQPFADFGPWTNQMPLSFLFPGAVQVLFGPGLRTGRYFAIFLSLLMLLALWLTTRRLAGRWWAVFIVWALALNIASVKIYTLAISEIQVGFLLAWTLFFILGEERKTWQIITGSVLSVMILLVRVNLAPVAALVALYIFWQHGRRKGWIGLAAAGLTFLIGNALFWPGILAIWADWLPQSLTPFLDPWRFVSTKGSGWGSGNGVPDLIDRVLYIFLSYRLHLLSLGGALVVWLLWPGGMRRWKSPSQFKTAVFLTVALVGLFAMHVWAAFYLGYCLSCLLLYLTFFDFLGLLLLAQSWSALPRTLPLWRAVLTGLVLFGFGLGISFSAFEEIQRSTIQKFPIFFGWGILDRFLRPLLEAAGYPEFKVLQIRTALYSGLVILAVIFGLALLAVYLFRRRNGRRNWGPAGVIFLLVCISLGLGLVFSTSKYLSGGNDFFACEGDVLQTYENTGKYLRESIPVGSKVFWVGRIPALLLYLPDSEIYPPQLNHFHNFRYGAEEDDELYRTGRWNESLGRKWLAEAEAVLVEDEWLDGWVLDAIQSSGLVELKISPKAELCRKESRIHIYLRR